MARTIAEAIQIEANKEYNRPIELYQLFLDDETLYLAVYPKDIQFFNENGFVQSYTATAISRSPITVSKDARVNEVTVEIDNVSKEMSDLLAEQEFRNKRIVIWKVFIDEDYEVVGDSHIPIFYGVMDEPVVDENSLEIKGISSADILEKQIPGRSYSLNCPWRFGDPSTCGVVISVGNETLLNGTVEGLSTDKLTIYSSDITVPVSGGPIPTDPDPNYWSHGIIKIDGKARLVVSSQAGRVRIDVPFFKSPAGKSFELQAGCDKTYGLTEEDYELNHGCAYWNNLPYFGGFLSIPDDR